MVDIVKQGIASEYAIIIMNPGQSVWDPETKTAMTFASWKTNKRGPSAILDGNKNTVPANESPEEHAKFVFNCVLNEIGPTTQIDIIACGMAAYSIVCFLDERCESCDASSEKTTVLTTDRRTAGPEWEGRMHSFAMAESTHSQATLTNPGFRDFLLRVGSQPQIILIEPQLTLPCREPVTTSSIAQSAIERSLICVSVVRFSLHVCPPWDP